MNDNFDSVNDAIKNLDFLIDKERAERIAELKAELDPILENVACIPIAASL